MTSPRIAFLDIDGTLIDHSERIADSTVAAVRAARANGHLVYLCTGRAACEIYPEIWEIGFDGAVTAGGGFAAIGDRTVISRPMPADDLARMIAAFDDAELAFYLQASDELYPNERMHDLIHRLAEDEAALAELPDDRARAVVDFRNHPVLSRLAHLRPMPTEGIAKAVFIGDDVAHPLADALGEDFHAVTGTLPYVGNGSGELSLAGVTKGSTILQLLEILGLDPADAIGIGDSANDLEMLDVVGVGIAMGNASDEVKARADEVTTAVDADGIHTAFTRHALI